MSKPRTTDPLQFRYPDDLNEISLPALFEIEREEPGDWLAQFKWDGWRSLLYKQDGKWTRQSKYDTGDQAKTPPPAVLMEELDSLKLPDGTAFDTEWMGRRCVDILGGRHFFIIHDLHYWQGQWQGDQPYHQRLANLKTLLELHRAKAKVKAPNIELVETSEMGFIGLYEKSKGMPLTEGIVIKRKDSLLKGGITAPVKNPAWMKVKWRR